jgi:hypothetical protein
MAVQRFSRRILSLIARHRRPRAAARGVRRVPTLRISGDVSRESVHYNQYIARQASRHSKKS